jgi:RNA-directed DNA polymerase
MTFTYMPGFRTMPGLLNTSLTSKKNVKTFLGDIRRTIKAALGSSAADLIKALNPKIRGWANYHRHTMNKSTFARVDYEIFLSLWRWARRWHPRTPAGWRKQKYLVQHSGRQWSFFGEMWDGNGMPSKIWLLLASSTPIKRHIKIKADANPYDPAYETYFEEREGAYMRESFRSTRTFAFLGMNTAVSARL